MELARRRGEAHIGQSVAGTISEKKRAKLQAKDAQRQQGQGNPSELTSIKPAPATSGH